MPPQITPPLIALSLLILAVFTGMLAAFLWVLLHVVTGARILPEVPPLKQVVPWSWRTVCGVVVAYLVLNQVIAIGYRAAKPALGIPNAPVAAAHLPKPKNDEHPPIPPIVKPPEGELSFKEILTLVSLVNVSCLIVIPLVLLPSTRRPFRDLGLSLDHCRRNVGLGVAAFFVATPYVMAVQLVAVTIFPRNSRHKLEKMLREGLHAGDIALAYLSAALLAPLVEEILFRGILQGWLTRLQRKPEPTLGVSELLIDPIEPVPRPPSQPRLIKRLLPRLPNLPGFGPTAPSGRSSLPIVLTSLIFALIHADQMPAPFAIFVLSLVLGWIKEASGSLLPGIILHALFNGLNTTLMVIAISMLPSNPDGMKKKGDPPAAKAANRAEIAGFRLARRGGC